MIICLYTFYDLCVYIKLLNLNLIYTINCTTTNIIC
jgi:hypothetical protein